MTASEMAELDRKLAVMQAFKQGAWIDMQSGYRGPWVRCTSQPNWDWAYFDYRIAPEPRKPPELCDTCREVLRRLVDG